LRFTGLASVPKIKSQSLLSYPRTEASQAKFSAPPIRITFTAHWVSAFDLSWLKHLAGSTVSFLRPINFVLCQQSKSQLLARLIVLFTEPQIPPLVVISTVFPSIKAIHDMEVPVALNIAPLNAPHMNLDWIPLADRDFQIEDMRGLESHLLTVF